MIILALNRPSFALKSSNNIIEKKSKWIRTEGAKNNLMKLDCLKGSNHVMKLLKTTHEFQTNNMERSRTMWYNFFSHLFDSPKAFRDF